MRLFRIRFKIAFSILCVAFILGFSAFDGALSSDEHSPRTSDGAAAVLERPNILFVVYDARRFDDFSFGAKGNSRNDTPFLSEFKNDAIFFEYAISPGVWTLPVHASMFTGLPIFSLRNDFYQENHNLLPTGIPTIAEILSENGYLTIAYADHPYFFSGEYEISLVRGFQYFNVITDFSDYHSVTNIGTPDGKIIKERRMPEKKGIDFGSLRKWITLFNEDRFPLKVHTVADFDEEASIYIPKLRELFKRADYFHRRLKKEFETYFLKETLKGKPYFLFLNIHMCTVAEPDINLLQKWYLLLLMVNAQMSGKDLLPPKETESFDSFFSRNSERLGLEPPHEKFKQYFDNRFYDVYFEFTMNYLNQNGLLDNTVVIVTSDHGWAWGEHGESDAFHGGARPHEYNTRVPLIIRSPSNSESYKHHGVYYQNVSLLDIFYTLLDISGLKEKRSATLPEEGMSILTRIKENNYDETIFSESSTKPENYKFMPGAFGEMTAIYSGNYKFIYAPDVAVEKKTPTSLLHGTYDRIVGALGIKDRPRQTQENNVSNVEGSIALLYDLHHDPGEYNNIFDDNEELRGFFLKKYAERYHSSEDKVTLKEQTVKPKFDKDAIETLRSLGYLQ